MSKLGTYATAILRGGLPAALDLGKQAALALGDGRPEQSAPSPKVEDRDTSRPAPGDVSLLDHMTAKQWVMVAVGGVVAITLLTFAIRGAARIR